MIAKNRTRIKKFKLPIIIITIIVIIILILFAYNSITYGPYEIHINREFSNDSA